jgi:NTP pyrophosphatase (non-canonical NTP hydrolase)
MTKRIDFQKYKEFVDGVTSEPSKDFLALTERLVELDEKGANIERLMTAAIGLNAESGEFLEIVKKLVYQGKEWNSETKNHLIVELGDALWYVTQALIALEVTMDEVVSKNIDKLQKRYPGGAFDAYYSENRDENDI